MPIRSVVIEGYRGFCKRRGIDLAEPCGKPGSGLTVLVGPNNSGKSTIVEAFEFLQRSNTAPVIPIDRRNAGANGVVSFAYADSTGLLKELTTRHRGGGDLTWTIADGWKGPAVWIVPSRRYLDDQTHYDPVFTNSRDSLSASGLPGYLRFPQRSMLGQRIGVASVNREAFDKIFREILPNGPDWFVGPASDTAGQRYELRFTGPAGAHASEGLGDGVVSGFWIADALYDAPDDALIVIDEPEASLHPQAQRRLLRVLMECSRSLQIVYATHSPYMISFESLTNGGSISRVFRQQGCTQIGSLSSAGRKSLASLVGDTYNPHVLGLDAREVFFLDDGVILTEGQEDVITYTRMAAQLGIEVSGQFYGWGVGGAGNMPVVAELLQDLGFQRVFGLLDAGQEDVAVRLRSQFPHFEFAVIPAADARGKQARPPGRAIEGLLATDGTLKPQHEKSMHEILNRAAQKTQPLLQTS